MSVELDPVELGFRRPFTQEVSEVLRLRNPHSDPVAFKVKTTAPKQYCVRPNSGRIEPGQNVEVQVLLQAMKEDPPPETKCKDKFLVQSVAVPANQEMNNTAAIWSSIEQNAKSSIQEKKIRVIFLPADGVSGTPRTNRASTLNTEEDPPAYSSPMSNAATPGRGVASGPVSRVESRPSDSKDLGQAVNSAGNPSMAGSTGAAASIATGAAAAVSSAVPTSTEELKAQLEESKATITRMTKQIQDQGLRQRKTEGGQEKSVAAQATAVSRDVAPAGVPVPIVAALCLLSFLLAYLLF